MGAIAWQIMQIEAAVSSFYSSTEGSRLADENMEIVSASPGVCGSKPPLSCLISINNGLKISPSFFPVILYLNVIKFLNHYDVLCHNLLLRNPP